MYKMGTKAPDSNSLLPLKESLKLSTNATNLWLSHLVNALETLALPVHGSSKESTLVNVAQLKNFS